MNVLRKLLSLFSLAPLSDLEHARSQLNKAGRLLANAQAQVKQSEVRVQTLEASCRQLKDEYANAINETEEERWRRAWAPPTMAEMEQQTKFRQSTLEQLRLAIPNAPGLAEASNRDSYTNPAHWTLYWIISRACANTISRMLEAQNEDTLSGAWCDSIATHATDCADHLTGIEIAYDAIYRHVKPAIKEKAVGSDILLLLGGTNLIGKGGGFRLIWVQAKRTDGAPYSLDFQSEKNSDGLQYEAIAKVNNPALGSVGLYMLYSSKISHIPAILVDQMQKVAVKGRTLDLSDHGCRLQELLLGTMARQDIGRFTTTCALTAFLDKVGNKAPYVIIRVASSKHELNLLKEVSNRYYQQLGIKLEREHYRENDFDLHL